MTRRGAMATLGAAAGMAVLPLRAAPPPDEPIVETRWGRVRGRREHKAVAFKGVRYGAPTGGGNRFMPPQDPVPWSGVQDAFQFGASAPQSNPTPPSGGGPSPIITAQIPRAPRATPAYRPPESEDCLFLNVWTADPSRARKRPVMVHLHGGFFRAGSGSGVDGSALAGRGDVVVVSLNHRLNIFGYNHLADIAGDQFRHSGNVGMLDIMAALRWVRDNIEAFGGDPRRVMVFGPSGGGMKTAFLMASPAASGLLHRAGVQSGPGLRMMDRDAASRAAEMALSHVGLSRSNAADIRMMEPERLLSAFHAVSGALLASVFTHLPSFAPVQDPELLPQHPFSPDPAPGTRAIPMLIGWNKEDMTFFMGADPEAFTLTEEGLSKRAERIFGGQSAALARYRDVHPGLSPAQAYIRLVTEREIMVPTIDQARRHAAAGNAGTYLYRFDWASPALGGKLGALHNIEGNFVFDTLAGDPELTGTGPAAQRLAQLVSEAWVNFASDGVPSAEGLPAWPGYEADRAAGMVLGSPPRVDPALGLEEYRVLAGAEELEKLQRTANSAAVGKGD